jgi:hypothetical protein
LNGDNYHSRYTVVTSFSPQGYELYGKRFIDTFFEYWPWAAQLVCYTEGQELENVPCVDLLSLGACSSFLDRHRANPVVQGKRESKSYPWAPKDRGKGYSFRHDPYKFARKVFAVADAARDLGSGRLVWIDADTYTKNSVPDTLVEDLLPDGVSLAYLARPGYHTECGFVGYNLDRPETHSFLKAYEDRYAKDLFLEDKAWDDCNQFDLLVEKLKPATKHIKHVSRSQPFDCSILGHYMVHLKGKRKLL